MSSTGKIARLPHHLREDLNHRLLDHESAETLLDWLNRQPDTQKILAQHFDGHPITPQNLSEWRTGGFAAWELRHDLLATAADLAETSDELNRIAARLPDQLATVLASRYASLLLHWDGEVTDEFNQKVRVLGNLCRAITQLRKFDSSPATRPLLVAPTCRAKAKRRRERSESGAIGDYPSSISPAATKSDQIQLSPPTAAPAKNEPNPSHAPDDKTLAVGDLRSAIAPNTPTRPNSGTPATKPLLVATTRGEGGAVADCPSSIPPTATKSKLILPGLQPVSAPAMPPSVLSILPLSFVPTRPSADLDDNQPVIFLPAALGK